MATVKSAAVKKARQEGMAYLNIPFNIFREPEKGWPLDTTILCM